VKAVGVILAIVVALVLQTTVGHFVIRGTVVVDLVLVVVVYVGLTSGPVTGLLAGAAAGLAQDALSSGVIGIGGLAKTLIGFATGIIGTQFIVSQPIPRIVVFLAATALHAFVFIGLYELLDLRQFGTPYAAVAGQAVGNALVGVVAFQLAELLPGVFERRGTQRARIRR
jgi:rod shape-determining protein MreD